MDSNDKDMMSVMIKNNGKDDGEDNVNREHVDDNSDGDDDDDDDKMRKIAAHS